FLVLSEAATGMAGAWFDASACCVPGRLYMVETACISSPRSHHRVAGGCPYSIDRCRRQWGPALVMVGVYFDSACRNGEVDRGDLSCCVPRKKRSSTSAFLNRAVAGAAHYWGHQWVGSHGTRFGDRCGDRIGDGWHGVPRWSTSNPSPQSRAGCVGWGGGVDLGITLSMATTHRVFLSRAGSDRNGVPDQPVVPRIRQRGALRGRVGGKQAKTVLSSGSPYRFCVGARRRRTWVRWSGDHRSFLRALRDSRISGLHQGANLVWPLPGDR